MSDADKIEAARALIEPLRATVLWQNANPNVMKAADLLAALADLADAQAQENARLKATLEWYASDEAWTMRQLESGHGDYGKRAREALKVAP